MSKQIYPPIQPQRNIKQKIVNFCFRITDGFGSVPVFLLTCVAIIFVFSLIPVIGFQKWNTGVGLFSNTVESALEMITGVGAMVIANSLRKERHDLKKAHADHRKDIADLHAKIDKLIEKK